MAYNPSSFNYTPMAPSQFQPSQDFLDFSKWLAQQGIDMFNLARADRNTQLAVANAFQQQQADRENALQQAQLQMAQQRQNVELPIAQSQANQAFFTNAQNRINDAFSTPWAQAFMASQEEKNRPQMTPWGQPIYYDSGSFIRGTAPTPRQSPMTFRIPGK